MAPLISNDLNSPVSLLWAHQLRREHASIVTQLEEVKELHPSASELKKVVTRTEKTEAAGSKIRKEFTELKYAYQKTVKRVEGLEKESKATEKARAADVVARGKHEEDFRLEIERLGESMKRQEGGLASTGEEVRKTRCQAVEGDAAMEQRLLRKDDEIAELRSLIRALEQKLDDAVIVVKDSVQCPKTNEVPDAPPDDESEADSFDLDANMLTVNATPSGPVFGPSLAMIKEPTVPRYSQRLRDQHQPSMGASMQMLPEPSLPPYPEPEQQEPKPKPLPEQIAEPDLNLIQGMSTLASYIQTAGSQHQETAGSPGREAKLVHAFVHGLRDKRDRMKCERRLKGAGKTWENLKDCFPVASQPSQKYGNKKGEVKRKRAEKLETREARGLTPTLPPAKEGMEVGKGERSQRNATPTTANQQNEQAQKQDSRGADRARPLPVPAGAKKTALVEQGNRDVERALLPPVPSAAKRRALVEQEDGQANDPHNRAPPAAKKRRTKKGGGRRERPPSIPILPSSDDEFSRGCRK